MKKLLTILTILSFTSIAFVSCKDDDDDNNSHPTPTSGDVIIDITNVAGTQNLDVTGATNYTNSFGETFNVTRFKYYISNVQLLNNGTVVYTMPESYFLVDESVQSTTKLTLPDVPPGAYTSVRFMVGVDSTRNVSGSQTGALDPANGMFWTWNSGYIFLKLEGTSTVNGGTNFVYHVGGFKDALNQNATRVVELDFNGSSMTVDGSHEAELHLIANVLNLFDAVQDIPIASVSTIHMPGANAMKMADNYAEMFTFDHIHN
jgi:hypothetical protein